MRPISAGNLPLITHKANPCLEFSLIERFLFMDFPLLLNLWRMRRCILESFLFQTFPGSRRHVLNLNAGMAWHISNNLSFLTLLQKATD